jgi:hypothetical protein
MGYAAMKTSALKMEVISSSEMLVTIYRLHDVITQKTIQILTAVETSYLMRALTTEPRR